MDWWTSVIEEYKYDVGNYIKEEGALQLNFFKYKVGVDDDIVNKVIAGMDKPQCDKVRYIYLDRCTQITDDALTAIGEHCRHLVELNLLSCGKVTDEGIAAVLRNNPKITYLSFSRCGKATSVSIDAVIDYCPDIKTLYAYSAGLTSLSENIGKLSELKDLNLRANSITILPLSIGNLPEDCKLNFDHNPIKNVPFSAIKEGPTAIQRFFELVEKEGAAKSNQLKVVLLGTGEAGKTSLLNSIIGIEKPLTTKSQRTIHVEIRDAKIHRKESGDPPLTLKCYDFGGQETYALGQSKYFDVNGLYILVVNADEKNEQVFMSHVQRLQAMAPSAKVLLVLSKADKLKTAKDVEAKVEWIQTAIDRFVNGVVEGKNNPVSSAMENGIDAKHLQFPYPDIIVASVKKDPANTKEKLHRVIQKLLDQKPPFFPSVGMKLPLSWLEVVSFTEALRLHGPNDIGKMGTTIKELKANNLQMVHDRMNHGTLSENREDDSTEISRKGRMNCLLQCFRCGKGGYIDTAHKNQSDKDDNYLCSYMRKDNFNKALQEYFARNDPTREADDVESIREDVLSLMIAQGDIIVYGDLIFLDPSFVASVMKALTNHTLVINELQLSDVNNYYLKKLTTEEYNELDHSFRKFMQHGELHLNVLKYLLRRLFIDDEDYDSIIHMLVETFAVFLTSIEVDDGPEKKLPTVLFRLEREADRLKIENEWPPICPSERNHFELRFEFPFGCPSSLAAHFAASAHALGICVYAYINGAIVFMKDSESLIFARFEEEHDNEKAYLSLAIRSLSLELSNVDKANMGRMVQFLEHEEEMTYPGLKYLSKILCHECMKNKPERIVSKCDWRFKSSENIFCTSCRHSFRVESVIGDKRSTEKENIQNKDKISKATASEISGFLHRNGEAKKPLVMLSARFNGDKYEDMARALARELQKKGVNVYIVEAGVGTTFGDKTIYGLYNMVVMVCFCSPNYGQKTKAIYSSFGELKFAAENGIPLVPIKMGDVWPPVPTVDFDGGFLGPAQNKFVFSADLVYNDWSIRDWDAVKCAEETKDALETMGKCPMIEQ